MNSGRIKLLPVVFLLLILFGCEKDLDSPYSINSRVLPGDFLSDKDYKELLLEVVYVDGYKPTTGALNNLVTFLDARLNKPMGITVIQRNIPTPGRTTVDASVLRELEQIHRQRPNTDKLITAWLFFVDAEYSTNTSSSKVLGVAYGASSIAVFRKTVDAMAGGINQPSTATLETTILEHEFCHILGLVNNGISMVAPHQDSDHAAHCTDTDCLMYYKAETRVIDGDRTGKGVPRLDADCLADLKAAGGK